MKYFINRYTKDICAAVYFGQNTSAQALHDVCKKVFKYSFIIEVLSPKTLQLSNSNDTITIKQGNWIVYDYATKAYRVYTPVMIKEHFIELYRDDQRVEVPKSTSNVTLEDVYEKMIETVKSLDKKIDLLLGAMQTTHENNVCMVQMYAKLIQSMPEEPETLKACDCIGDVKCIDSEHFLSVDLDNWVTDLLITHDDVKKTTTINGIKLPNEVLWKPEHSKHYLKLKLHLQNNHPKETSLTLTYRSGMGERIFERVVNPMEMEFDQVRESVEEWLKSILADKETALPNDYKLMVAITDEEE